jgi:hypothetical protein
MPQCCAIRIARSTPRREQLRRQAVMNRAHPARLRERPPLRIGDRDHRHRGECRKDRLMLRQIEPAVQCRDEWCRLAREQREWIVVQVEMQKIEIGPPLPHALQHQHVQRIGVAHRTVEPQRARP